MSHNLGGHFTFFNNTEIEALCRVGGKDEDVKDSEKMEHKSGAIREENFL